MVVQQYYRVLNELRQDDAEPLARLRAVATSLDLAAQERFIRGQRRDGLRQVGDTEVADLIVQSVDLNNSDPKAGLVPTVVVDVCYDVTRADIVDADGESVVPVDRPDRGWVRHTVANYNWDSEPAKAWRVASSKTIEREPCTA